jgi:hypothetical protein
MRPWSSVRPGVAFHGLALLALILSACSAGAPSGSAVSGSSATAPPTAMASADPGPTVSLPTASEGPGGPSPTIAVGAEPPAASLSVEGGDPVAGQLGSFTWNGGGSDSPWLPGTRLSIGAGERLTASLAGGVAVDTWSARSAPAGSSDGTGAVGLGDGSGDGSNPMAFAPPAKGRWSVQLTVGFADELGSATYYWQVIVR